jgi:hypothetical protein
MVPTFSLILHHTAEEQEAVLRVALHYSVYKEWNYGHQPLQDTGSVFAEQVLTLVSE